MTPIITLLTDFGLTDPYVGQMKGVLLTHCPSVRIVDLSHGIPVHDIGVGAFYLKKSWCFFPEGTIHLAVVDPDVGMERDLVVLCCSGHFFLGPDNGLLSSLCEECEVYRLRCDDVIAAPSSNTFHGRDFLAPIAGSMVNGKSPEDLGEKISVGDLVSCPLLESINVVNGEIVGEVLFSDGFGNLVTNLEVETPSSESKLFFKDREVPIVRTYGEGESGKPCGLVNSFGVFEVAVPMGSASNLLGAKSGDLVTLRGS